MSYDPEDYPGEYPDEWYDTLPGKIVGFVALLRAMLDENRPTEIDGYLLRGALVINFTLGNWYQGVWVDTVEEGEACLLGLDERDPTNPAVVLGDVKIFEETIVEDDEEEPVIPIAQYDLLRLPLLHIGSIFAMEIPPDLWEDEN